MCILLYPPYLLPGAKFISVMCPGGIWHTPYKYGKSGTTLPIGFPPFTRLASTPILIGYHYWYPPSQSLPSGFPGPLDVTVTVGVPKSEYTNRTGTRPGLPGWAIISIRRCTYDVGQIRPSHQRPFNAGAVEWALKPRFNAISKVWNTFFSPKSIVLNEN